MYTFFIALFLLLAGFAVYGRFVERIFKPTDCPTPATTMADGVDYVEMPTWKIFLIQLLNIAGPGPIFGALMGAVFGPVVFIWIVCGCILGGAVHDYCSGMISIRNRGCDLSEIVGENLGGLMRKIMAAVIVVLMTLVGAVMVMSPAALLAMLTPETLGLSFWAVVIFIYYVIATILPIDKVIGRIYPVFGFVLILMVLLIGGGIILEGYEIPELVFENQHPDLPVWPFMFITVACGAISGFHATQSPIMARCMRKETDGRKVFYGAMIMEGIIALVWAAAGMAFYDSSLSLHDALATMGQSGVVYEISTTLLGAVGGILAIVGVIVCPISSGDTAFRAARITLADTLHLDQRKLKNRLVLAVPLLVASAVLTQVDFDIVWRYFSWVNQSLSMITLWAVSVYLARHVKRGYSLVAALPATFMSGVCSTYILMAPEGLGLAASVAYPLGLVFALTCLAVFMFRVYARAGGREASAA